MQNIQRVNDVISFKQDLDHLFTLKDFPVFMGCVTQSRSEDKLNDMSFYISRGTGMIQLNPILPLELVYQSEHYSGSVGPSWDQHHKSFAEFISKFTPKNVFEIGGAHGKLSEIFYDINPNCQWTIIEPNPTPPPNLKAKLINGFFDKTTEIPKNVDMLVHSHVLEHFYNPHEFFQAASNLSTGTVMCFSVPALKKHLKQQFTNTINFEHTYLCTEEFIEWWLDCYGFDLVEKHYYKNDHSIFYSAIKNNKQIKLFDPPNIYEENLKLVKTYYEFHINLIANINEQIKRHNGKVFLFGAHVFSQFLISFGLDVSRIDCILDNSIAKQNKRLYGTDLMVYSPKILSEIENPLVILRSGVFDEEIKSDILNNINSNVKFIK